MIQQSHNTNVYRVLINKILLAINVMLPRYILLEIHDFSP